MTHQRSLEPASSRRVALGLLTALPLATSGVPAAAPARAADRSGAIPKDTRPGGAYDRYVAKLAAEDRFSGTVLLAHRGRTVLARAYGLADRQRRIPNRLDTIYNLASAAKPFTGLAIVQLAQRNKLRFTDLIGQHLTGYPAATADRVSIHHLLTHTSGLPNFPNADRKQVTHSVEEETAFHNSGHRQVVPAFVPGSKHSYSSTGFSILGEIVESISGLPFHEYIRRNIFQPAGMTSSAYYTRPDWLTDPRIAHPYIYQTDGNRVDGVRNLDAGAVLNGGQGTNAARAFIGSGGGGGFSSAPDLVRFAQALARPGTLLDPAFTEVYLGPKFPTLPLSGRPAPGNQQFAAYGPICGIVDNQRLTTHGGGIAGGNTNWTIYRDGDWIGVILCNYDLDIPAIITAERAAVLDPPTS
ncbi:serine hydrolase domain-containing protein [Kribbella sp. NPDC050124]|uniref:serine hydrolase domain-containing protein n=1 Tax=Kribbella sp. NPDC050124 TaxID=3364114 RepID=UPI00378BA6F2